MSKRRNARSNRVSTKNPRSSLLHVRLNSEERRLFEEKASTLGLSLSSWARMVLRREVVYDNVKT